MCCKVIDDLIDAFSKQPAMSAGSITRQKRSPLRARMAYACDSGWIAGWLDKGLRLTGATQTSLAGLLRGCLLDGAIRAGCIEELAPGGGWQPVALGVSCFTERAFLDVYLEQPYPSIASHLLHRLVTRRGPGIMSVRDVARANAGDGVDLVVLAYMQPFHGFDGDLKGAVVASRAVEHFIHAHRGYNIRRLLREDERALEAGLTEFGMHCIARFDAGAPCALTGPLAAPTSVTYYAPDLTRPHLQASTVSLLFHALPPQIGFTLAETRLLSLAVDGLSDDEIASVLEISVHTIKQNWRSIFARAEAVVPQAVGPQTRAAAAAGRGAEKRRHLLVFLANHPEEMRPNLAT